MDEVLIYLRLRARLTPWRTDYRPSEAQLEAPNGRDGAMMFRWRAAVGRQASMVVKALRFWYCRDREPRAQLMPFRGSGMLGRVGGRTVGFLSVAQWQDGLKAAATLRASSRLGDSRIPS